jgi:hypothetical protein
MKRLIRITGILLIMLIAGSLLLHAQRGMRGMMDTTRMTRQGNRMYERQPMGPPRSGDSLMIRDMRRFNGPPPAYGMRRGMRRGNMYGPGPGASFGRRGFAPGPMYGMRGGTNRMPAYRPANRPYGPAMMRIENIPNLTDKQKKDIADLREKDKAEMQKLRQETTAKIQTMKENNRKKLLDLLTDEQKKFIEPGDNNDNTTGR